MAHLLTAGSCRFALALATPGAEPSLPPLALAGDDKAVRAVFLSGVDYWQRRLHGGHSWVMRQVVKTLLLVRQRLAAVSVAARSGGGTRKWVRRPHAALLDSVLGWTQSLGAPDAPAFSPQHHAASSPGGARADNDSAAATAADSLALDSGPNSLHPSDCAAPVTVYAEESVGSASASASCEPVTDSERAEHYTRWFHDARRTKAAARVPSPLPEEIWQVVCAFLRSADFAGADFA